MVPLFAVHKRKAFHGKLLLAPLSCVRFLMPGLKPGAIVMAPLRGFAADLAVDCRLIGHCLLHIAN